MAKRGRPKGSTKINTNVDMVISHESTNGYRCTCCGKTYRSPLNNFLKSPSPLFKGNEGYIPYCNVCRKQYYLKLLELFNNDEKPCIERFCQIADLYMSDRVFDCSRPSNNDGVSLGSYLRQLNLPQNGSLGKTYADTIKDRAGREISSIEQLEDMKNNGEATVSKAAIDRWGIGFTNDDYEILESHYRVLKKTNPIVDDNSEIFVRDLCYNKMLQTRALKDGKAKEFDDLAKSYREMFKQAGFKITKEDDGLNTEEPLGVWISRIAQYTPEEYYKNKKLYKDYDKLGEYFDRFVKRPLKNLVTGSKERDAEYTVREELGDG